MRKPHGGRLRVALAFPNTYFVGMSNLGFQTVYSLFNAEDGISTCVDAKCRTSPATISLGPPAASAEQVIFLIRPPQHPCFSGAQTSRLRLYRNNGFGSCLAEHAMKGRHDEGTLSHRSGYTLD